MSNAVLLAVCCVATVILGAFGGISGFGATGSGDPPGPATRAAGRSATVVAVSPRPPGCGTQRGHVVCTGRNFPAA